MMFASATAQVTPEKIEALKKMFGFVDAPLWEQYLTYIKSIFSGNLGVSTQFFPATVNDVLASAFGWSLFLAGTAIIVAFAIGSVMGIFAAWFRGSRYDSFASPLMMVFQAVPPVVVALLALFIFGVGLQWFPTSYAFTPGSEPEFSLAFISDVMYHAILPVGCAALIQVGGFLITMRNNMINLLNEDFITMAKAKGLSQNRVVFNYAARNAILPTVTALSMALGTAIGGQLIIEIVFNYPGLGTVLYKAILARDYQVIQGQLLLMCIFMLAFNFIADLLYVVLDPRLRKGGN
ncbi:ABC transporter permease [Plesiomonas shigelloides]|nr:ABC transporter permease [Plesiomonas shigelloides]QWK94949.1 ABC transporter permease [Plesiomonas shigelloides]QWK97569.1 ABC transporter permease [Plesiomonas shigelloides]